MFWMEWVIHLLLSKRYQKFQKFPRRVTVKLSRFLWAVQIIHRVTWRTSGLQVALKSLSLPIKSVDKHTELFSRTDSWFYLCRLGVKTLGCTCSAACRVVCSSANLVGVQQGFALWRCQITTLHFVKTEPKFLIGVATEIQSFSEIV